MLARHLPGSRWNALTRKCLYSTVWCCAPRSRHILGCWDRLCPHSATIFYAARKLLVQDNRSRLVKMSRLTLQIAACQLVGSDLAPSESGQFRSGPRNLMVLADEGIETASCIVAFLALNVEFVRPL
jgi:hypothetical protein